MKLEDQVCSFELAGKLKELGVKQTSLFCYQPIESTWPSVFPRKFNLDEFANPSDDERIAAFTVAELGEILPINTNTFQGDHELKWECCFHCGNGYHSKSGASTEADARAKMLVYLLENKLMELPK